MPGFIALPTPMPGPGPYSRSRRGPALFALAVALIVIGLTLRPHWTERHCSYSESVQAQVVRAVAGPAPAQRDATGARVMFRYIHQGHVYTSSRFTVRGGQLAAARRYRHGDWITAMIDPRHPGRAIARPGFSLTEWLSLAAGLLMMATAVLLFVRVFRRETVSKYRDRPRPGYSR